MGRVGDKWKKHVGKLLPKCGKALEKEWGSVGTVEQVAEQVLEEGRKTVVKGCEKCDNGVGKTWEMCREL